MTLTLLAAAILILTGLFYVVACVWAPFTDCGTCGGYGRSPGYGYRMGRAGCPTCRGTGLTLRTGRRIFNWLRRTTG